MALISISVAKKKYGEDFNNTLVNKKRLIIIRDSKPSDTESVRIHSKGLPVSPIPDVPVNYLDEDEIKKHL